MNFKDIIKQSILDNFTGDITPEQIITVLAISLAFGLYIFYIYRVAVNNEFYSKDFNKTLTLMAVVTAAIVLSLQANLVISLGMVGALSIVRFRTAVKSSFDLFFLYWSISIGIICGAGLFLLAGISSIIITVVIFLLNYAKSPGALSLLVIQCKSIDIGNQAIDLVQKHTSFSRLKNKTIGKSSMEIILEIKVTDEHALDTALSALDGVDQFSFMSFDRETRI